MNRLAALAVFSVLASTVPAQHVEQSYYNAMEWRCIGPFRGGRTVGAVGIPTQPNVFYIGGNNGGVWKTNDAGRTWKPIFDDQPTGSIGAIAIAPSNPNVLYVGCGEGLQRPDLSVGDGMYKSADAGKTWVHLGLRDGQQIGSIIVDPKDPNRLFVAVLGHPYGPNPERGVFRSLDGGKTFKKVLYKGVDTGAIQVAFDPNNSKIVFADMWAGRLGPWENGGWHGQNSGLFKSIDGGNTWSKLTKGLPKPDPKDGLGRIGFSIAPSNPKRMYATVDEDKTGGIYRSNDAGASWTRINTQDRLFSRGDDFAEIKADPTNENIVYVANTETYKSTDGGLHFTGWKGAPGGDDYHTFWINPLNPRIILLASDQGATITVNGGETWSSWYNQPTAQFYHVSTDNQFPYWVYGGQQESGSAMVQSRGNDGQITFREWHPVGAEEYGYVAPDPLDNNIVYGGKLSKFYKSTGHVEDVRPKTAARYIRTAPVLFSPVDPHTLYFAGNLLFKTTDGAKTWQTISPDLTREHPDVPANIGIYKAPEMATMKRRGVIYAVAPSNFNVNTIWAGTDDGLIHVTHDGGANWANVTPPELTAWSKVSMLDAGRFDDETAYAAINRIRLDDMKPHIFRTHDGGKTWKEIVSGLPNDPVNTVREDPIRKGLLYCGTERAVYFSMDDGNNWNPLRLNMPATSIRDLVVHENDLVIGTHGRSFWILDDINPLRELDTSLMGGQPKLVQPPVTYIVERNTNSDTPLPPEEPAGKNPPDGAILDYWLPYAANELSLEISDSSGKVIRRFTNKDVPVKVKEESLQVPTYWLRPFKPLLATMGAHRFVWDLHGEPPKGKHEKFYPISAIIHDTPAEPLGEWATPGVYTVKLTVDGQVFTRSLTLKPDPRMVGGPLKPATDHNDEG